MKFFFVVVKILSLTEIFLGVLLKIFDITEIFFDVVSKYCPMLCA